MKHTAQLVVPIGDEPHSPLLLWTAVDGRLRLRVRVRACARMHVRGRTHARVRACMSVRACRCVHVVRACMCVGRDLLRSLCRALTA